MIAVRKEHRGQEIPVQPPKWQWILGIALAFLGAIDEVNVAVFGDRGTTGSLMFLMLVAGVCAGRAIDRWKERTLYHWFYFVPLGIVLGLAAWGLLSQ